MHQVPKSNEENSSPGHTIYITQSMARCVLETTYHSFTDLAGKCASEDYPVNQESAQPVPDI